MTNKPKAIGTAAESAVVRICKAYGWPDAHRNSLHGAVDVGDIWIHPKVVIEVKGGNAARNASDNQILEWLVSETDVERIAHGADVGILVVVKRGVGPDNAHNWHAYMTLAQLMFLMDPYDSLVGDGTDLWRDPVRVSLHTALRLLRNAGYGLEKS